MHSPVRLLITLALLSSLAALAACSWLGNLPDRIRTVAHPGGPAVVHEHLSYASDPRGKGIRFSRRDLAELKSLCVTKNNYWCVKTPGGDTWRGQVDEDLAHHAIFSDPAWSARAFARIMRSYRFRHNLRTAREVISRYAPPSDCIGSAHYCPADSRLLYGMRDLPYAKMGNRWVQYAQSVPPGFVRGGDCFVALMHCPRGFNPTHNYAESIAAAVGRHPDQDLGLFFPDGQINPQVAVPLFRAFAKWELGAQYRVSDDLILRGIALESRS